MAENAATNHASPQASESGDQAAPGGQKAGGKRLGRKHPAGAGSVERAAKPTPWKRIILIAAVVVALIIGVPWGLSWWRFNATHVSTDDAYVSGNLVNVSPVVSGTLQELKVDENTYVRRGDLIARLSDAGPRATLRQALANYRAAQSQIPQAERNLAYQKEASDAAVRRAEAALGSQLAKTRGAERQVTLTAGSTQNQIRQSESQLHAAEALSRQAAAQAQAADSSVESYQQAVITAIESQDNYRQQVTTAEKALAAAQGRVTGAQSEVDRTAKDEARYRVLYTQDAVAAQVYDNARAQARGAAAALATDQSLADEAASQIEQARAGLRQAASQVEQARKAVAQAQAQATAAHRGASAAAEQVEVARAGVGVARANGGQVAVQRENLASTSEQTGESRADIATARAGEQQVAVRRKQIETYRLQAAQAKAALDNAQIALDDTLVYAPYDGTIVKKVSNTGASLSPGQTIVTMTQGDYVWVDANFKETQLKDVRPGEPAEVEIDALPGRIFKARVQSINRATGAATSLLPPDNATGNFTKVVQRVPVRLEFVAAGDGDDPKYARAKDLANVRQGMSVVATVDVDPNAPEVKRAETEAASSRGAPAGGSMPGGAPASGRAGGPGAAQGGAGGPALMGAPPTDSTAFDPSAPQNGAAVQPAGDGGAPRSPIASPTAPAGSLPKPAGAENVRGGRGGPVVNPSGQPGQTSTPAGASPGAGPGPNGAPRPSPASPPGNQRSPSASGGAVPPAGGPASAGRTPGSTSPGGPASGVAPSPGSSPSGSAPSPAGQAAPGGGAGAPAGAGAGGGR